MTNASPSLSRFDRKQKLLLPFMMVRFTCFRSYSTYLKVLGTGSSEISPCLIFNSKESGHLVFNCPENLPRALSDFSLKPNCIRDIFVTKTSWDNFGGLPGLIKLSDMSPGACNKKFYVRGPQNMVQFQRNLLKPYISNSRIDFTPAANDFKAVYENNGVRIVTVEVNPFHFDSSTGGNNISRDSVVVYIGELINSFVDDLSCDSVSVVDKGHCLQFVVLECPSLSTATSLVFHPLLQQTLLSPRVIVHITPYSVLQSELYQKWMNGFDHNTQHLLVNADICPSEISISNRLKMHLSLHMIDPHTFHLPSYPTNSNNPLISNSSVIIGRNSLKFHLVDGTVECYTRAPLKVQLNDAFNILMSNDKFKELMPSWTKEEEITEFRKTFDTLSGGDTKLTFLGGGLSSCNEYRSINSILLHLPNNEFILLDAGEGTLSQLYKCFGPSVADDILRKLKCVFISHIHADHSLGLISVLLKRQQLLGSDNFDSTLIVGPNILYKFLKNYGYFCEDLYFKYIKLSSKPHADTLFKPPQTLSNMGLTSITLVPVIHCAESYGVVLCHKDGWKLVYSGDTRPSRDLVKAGRKASLLIHESTFCHNLLKKAILSNHSTDIEAIQVAKDMDVEYLILTHFGETSRSKLVSMSNHLTGTVGLAFDFMTVSLNNIERFSMMSSRIKRLLAIFENDLLY